VAITSAQGRLGQNSHLKRSEAMANVLLQRTRCTLLLQLLQQQLQPDRASLC
jgi:hypothetical protein